MKKFVILLILSMVLAFGGCKTLSHNEEEDKTARAETEKMEPSQAETLKVQDESAKAVEVVQGGPYGEISISLPLGWSYEVCPIDSDNLSAGMYGIHFYPEGVTKGYVELAYIDFFGVCGTGLAEQTVTLAGSSANIGTYDNHEYWDFISFQGECEGMVALTYSVEEWWSEYGAQVLDILDTLSFDQSVKEGGAYVYHEEAQIDEIGLYFSLKNISSTGASLVFKRYDVEAPTGTLQFGDEFMIETKKDGGWEEVPVIVEGNYAFNAVAYMLTSDMVEQELDWEWLYGELAPGEYRIRKSVDDFRKTGDYDKYTIYGYFILN